MAVATSRFSDTRLSRKIDGQWTATLGWDVIAFASEDDAVAATGFSVGSPHPRNQYLKCTNIGFFDNKLTLGRIIANFEITSLLASPENPVNRAPVVSWSGGKNSQATDIDLNGNPILNSAGDAFRSYGSRNFSVKFLTITRYEPFFDQAASDLYTDTVTSASVTFQGATYGPGQMYCHSILPVESYQLGCDYVKIGYKFEIRTPTTPNLTALQKRHPFQRRILDQGLRAKYNDPTHGKILGQLYTGCGNPLSRDALLNGKGVPIDSAILVTQGALAPIAQTLPNTVLVDTAAGGQVWLIYMDYAEQDFTQIGVSG